MVKTGFKIYLFAKFGKLTLFNKNIFKKFFLDTSLIYYVLRMHVKPLKNFLLHKTVFIFTLEDDCNKNWIFCFLIAFFPLKIRIFLTFILSFFTQNCKIFMFYCIGKGQNVDIYPSKRLWKLSVTKIGQSFSKPILSP
jgi:hypothetical protein